MLFFVSLLNFSFVLLWNVLNFKYFENLPQLCILIAFHTKLRNSLDELLEVHLSVAIIVKYLCNKTHIKHVPNLTNPPITLCTSGFCCNSGNDMNSSTLSDPELSKSSFLNLKKLKLR